MSRQPLLIIGDGIAGTLVLEELLTTAPDQFDITIFSNEASSDFNNRIWSPALNHILRSPIDFYKRNRIHLRPGTIKMIDRVRRTVIVADGTEVPYERLVLATGSTPLVSQMPGHTFKGVIDYQNIYDMRTTMASIAASRHAVVLGGSLLGIEAANHLRLHGIEVTIVHLAETLLERRLDPVAGMLMQRLLEACGLSFVLGRSAMKIIGNNAGEVSGVRLDNGVLLPTDLVAMAADAQPNTALARAAGLNCDHGIVVDDALQTNDRYIYAVGDCASHRGVVCNLLAQVYEQVEFVANHLAFKGTSRYRGSVSSAKLEQTDVNFFSIGDCLGGVGTEEIVLIDGFNGIYKKVVTIDDEIVGACLLGDITDGAWYIKLLHEGRKLGALRDYILFGESNAHEAGL